MSDDRRVLLVKATENRNSRRTLREEFLLLSNLTSPFFAQACDLVEDEHTCLVLNDVAGLPFNEHLAIRAFTSDQLLQVARQLVSATKERHSHRLLYCNYSPDGIFYHRESQSLTLMDFSAVLDMDSQHREAEATMAYHSPELTGMLGREIDERSDFHGIGVLLFKLATGKFPFEDVSNLERSLLSVQASPVGMERPDLPAKFADLIDQLVRPIPKTVVSRSAKSTKI